MWRASSTSTSSAAPTRRSRPTGEVRNERAPRFSLPGSFNEAHILAITQAICEYRRGQAIDGPLYMGKDTHALSAPAQRTALEVLAANGVETIIQQNDAVTPTPVISRAILVYNRGRKDHFADGIVITPSHNPPQDGGFKYNPANGGPADTEHTKWIENRANELLRTRNAGVKRVPFATAFERRPLIRKTSFFPTSRSRECRRHRRHSRRRPQSGCRSLGGARCPYWEPINSIYKLNVHVVNRTSIRRSRS